MAQLRVILQSGHTTKIKDSLVSSLDTSLFPTLLNASINVATEADRRLHVSSQPIATKHVANHHTVQDKEYPTLVVKTFTPTASPDEAALKKGILIAEAKPAFDSALCSSEETDHNDKLPTDMNALPNRKGAVFQNPLLAVTAEDSTNPSVCLNKMGELDKAKIIAVGKANKKTDKDPNFTGDQPSSNSSTVSRSQGTSYYSSLPVTEPLPVSLWVDSSIGDKDHNQVESSNAILSAAIPPSNHLALQARTSSVTSLNCSDTGEIRSASNSFEDQTEGLVVNEPLRKEQISLEDVFLSSLVNVPANFQTHYVVGRQAQSNLLDATLQHPDKSITGDVLDHALIITDPNILEVGIATGSHGWLKIRAELSTDGKLSAVLTAPVMAAKSLHDQLPSLASYLQNERLAVHSLSVITERGGGTDKASEKIALDLQAGEASFSSGDNASNSDSRRNSSEDDVRSLASKRRLEADQSDVKPSAIIPEHNLSNSGAVSPVVHGSGGNWLSIRA